MVTLKKFRKILILAILIRLLLMPFLFHPDIKSQYFHGQFLSDGVLDIYNFVKVNKNNLPYKDTFNYPPMTYYFLGSWYLLTKPILGGNFQNFLNYWGKEPYFNQDIFLQMFILKIPYLIADLALGISLTFLVEEKLKKRILILWLFNPVNLYIIYGLSNFDILPAFFSVLSVLFWERKKVFLSGLSLGGGIAFKIYPVLLLPFFILKILKNKDMRSFFIFLGACVLLPVLSVGFSYKDFLSISQSGLLSGLLIPQVIIAGFGIPIFSLIYILIFVLLLFNFRQKFDLLFLSLLTLLLVSNWIKIHPQWFLWSLPFLIYYFAKDLTLSFCGIAIFIGFLFLILSFNDEYLSLGILSPIFPQIYNVSMLSVNIEKALKGVSLDLISRIFFILFSTLILVQIFFKKRFGNFNLQNKNLINFQLGLVSLLGVSMLTASLFYLSHKSLNAENDSNFTEDYQIYQGHSLNQNFISQKNNLDLIYLNLSNTDLKNVDQMDFKILNNGQLLRNINLSGSNIGFDDNTKFQFSPIENSQNLDLQMSLETSALKSDDSIKAFKNSNGDFIYSAYSESSFIETVTLSLKTFLINFFFDKGFAIFYILLIMGVSLSYFYV